jgi:hypothetical protein
MIVNSRVPPDDSIARWAREPGANEAAQLRVAAGVAGVAVVGVAVVGVAVVGVAVVGVAVVGVAVVGVAVVGVAVELRHEVATIAAASAQKAVRRMPSRLRASCERSMKPSDLPVQRRLPLRFGA